MGLHGVGPHVLLLGVRPAGRAVPAAAGMAAPARTRGEPGAYAAGEVGDATVDGAHLPAAGRARAATGDQPALRGAILTRTHPRPLLPPLGRPPTGLAPAHPGHGV